MARKRDLPPGIERRGKQFRSNIRVNGDRVRIPLGDDLDLAVKALAVLRGNVVRGDVGMKRTGVPLSMIRAKYLDHVKDDHRTASRYAPTIDEFLGFSRAATSDDVTVEKVKEWRRAMVDRGSYPRTVNKKAGMIRTWMQWATTTDAGPLLSVNPLSSLKRLDESRKAKDRRALEPDELHRLIEATTPGWRLIFRFIAGTGCRKNEAVLLKRAQLDLKRGTARLLATTVKKKKDRIVPLDAQLWTDLKAHMKAGGKSEYVFHTKDGAPKLNNSNRVFYAACRRAKPPIEGGHPRGSVDIHALRVSWATMALENGANPKDVQEVLGHEDYKMVMSIYAKVRDSGKRSAVNAIPWPQNGPSESQSSQNAADCEGIGLA